MIRLPAATWALVAANAMLAGLLIWRVTAQSSVADLESGVATPAVNVPEISTALQQTPVDFDLVRNAALFHAGREFIAIPDPSSTPAVVRPQYQFIASMVMPNQKSVAYLRKSTGASPIKVRLGDSVDGWSVTIIEAKRVVAEFNGEQVEFAGESRSVSGLTRVQAAQALVPPLAANGIRLLSAETSPFAAVQEQPHAERKPRTYRPLPEN